MGIIKNPVLPGFHPDPSIIYYGGWFYIANSTFEWFGGVEISRSRDLSFWEPVCRPLSTRSHLDMIGNPASGGVWAPCLSWADGLFWLIFTDVKSWNSSAFKDTPNYVTTAEEITGPWSKPVLLNRSGFDPSLFHDDDGKKYLVNMEWDYRRQGTNQFSGILLQEFDPVTRALTGEAIKIFLGTDIGLVEGPHLYKHDGFYYLMCAEGGTEYNHAVTIARSRTIRGPYEVHPQNPLCTSRNHTELHLQKAGHGSMCQGRNGQWFLAFLVGRPLPGTNRCVLGRETAIMPLVWKDGWPYLANGTNNPELAFEVPWETGPQKLEDKEYRFRIREEQQQFLTDFMTLRIPLEKHEYSFSVRPGFLRLYGGESPVSRHHQTLFARRQTAFRFKAETAFEFNSKSFQEMAGLIYRYDEENWYYLRLSWNEKYDSYSLGLLIMDNDKFFMPLGEHEIPIHARELKNSLLYVRAEVNYRDLCFFYSLDGTNWTMVESPEGSVFDASIISDDYGGLGFTGAFIGICCQDMHGTGTAHADFAYFKYEEFQ